MATQLEPMFGYACNHYRFHYYSTSDDDQMLWSTVSELYKKIINKTNFYSIK